MKPSIIPAVLSDERETVLQRLRLVDGITHWVQLDVMDATLVPEKSWFDPAVLKKLDPSFSLELHLMIQNPLPVIKKFLGTNYFRRAIWHMEAPIDHAKLIAFCHAHGIQAGLALAPETDIHSIEPYKHLINEVLILGVHPGASGQKLLPNITKKIVALKKIAPKLPLGFDGGITDRNWKTLVNMGVSRLCMTHAIWEHKDPVKFLRHLIHSSTQRSVDTPK